MWDMQIRRLIYVAGTFGLCITSSSSSMCSSWWGKSDFTPPPQKHSECTVCFIILPKPKHTGVWRSKWSFCCPAHSSDGTMCAPGSQSACGEAGGTACALIKPLSVWRQGSIVLLKGTRPPLSHTSRTSANSLLSPKTLTEDTAETWGRNCDGEIRRGREKTRCPGSPETPHRPAFSKWSWQNRGLHTNTFENPTALLLAQPPAEPQISQELQISGMSPNSWQAEVHMKGSPEFQGASECLIANWLN